MTAIEVEGLVKRYDDRTVVDDVSFTVEAGEVFGIVGPNGAGKTTIVEMIEGLRRPDAGRIRVHGLDPLADAAEVRQRLGVQLQESRLPDKLRVWEAMDLFASMYEDPAPWPSSWTGSAYPTVATRVTRTCPVVRSSGCRRRLRSSAIPRSWCSTS